MLALRDLQTAFRRTLLEEDMSASGALDAEVAAGGLAAGERIAVYRNNVFASLTDALKETFPVVCRLVDERFFSYAAHEFIASHPPKRPALLAYGGAFPDFLSEFPPCGELVYLADVARFEWLMNLAAYAADVEPASPECLGAIAPDDAARLSFRLHPSYSYLASRWPIARIWRANRADSSGEGTIDLASGGVRLEVSRQGGDVVFRALDEADFAFRQALAAGSSLGEALERALAIDSNFPAPDALTALFAEGAVAAVTLSSSGTEPTS
jgi:hypothetical protein